MKRVRFKPRATFNADLHRLTGIDHTIVEEVRVAVDLLSDNGKLETEFKDHELGRRMSGYNELHLRDTPKVKKMMT